MHNGIRRCGSEDNMTCIRQDYVFLIHAKNWNNNVKMS
jgi:hypothetical protein